MKQNLSEIDCMLYNKESPQANKSPGSMLKKRNTSSSENQFLNNKSCDSVSNHKISKKFIISSKQNDYSLDDFPNTENQKLQGKHHTYPVPLNYPQEDSKEECSKKFLIDKNYYPDGNCLDTKLADINSSRDNSKLHDYAQIAEELKNWTDKYRRKQKNPTKTKISIKRSPSQESKSIKKELTDKIIYKNTFLIPTVKSNFLGNNVVIKKENSHYAETVSEQSDADIPSKFAETEIDRKDSGNGDKNATINTNKDTEESNTIKSKQTNKDYINEYQKFYNQKMTERNKEQVRKEKERIREYQKKYRKENKEKLNGYSRDYRQKNREKLILYSREYNEKSRGKLNGEYSDAVGDISNDSERNKAFVAKMNTKEYYKKYHQKNRVLSNKRTKEWCENNRERHKANKKEYYMRNREHNNKRTKEYYMKNRERNKVHKKEYYVKNREKLIGYQRKWLAKNREKQQE